MIRKLFSYYWIFIFIVIYFYGQLFILQPILFTSANLNLNLNAFDILLKTTGDMYLLLYFIFPLMIYIAVKNIIKNSTSEHIIRFGYYKKWVIFQTEKFGYNFLKILGIWVAASVCLTMGIHYTNEWSEFSSSQDFSYGQMDFSLWFSNPLIALLLQILLFILFVFSIYFLLILLCVYFKNKKLILISSVILFFNLLIGFKLYPSTLKFLNFSNYISYYSGVVNLNSKLTPFIGLFVILTILLFFIYLSDKNYFNMISFIKKKFLLILYFVFILLGMFYWGILHKQKSINYWEYFSLLFRGNIASADFIYLPYLYYMIIFIGYVIFIQLSLEKEINLYSYYKIIRERSLIKWFFKWLSKTAVITIIFLFFLFFLSFIMAILTLEINVLTIIEQLQILNKGDYIFHFFINGLLQLTIYILLSFLIYWIFKKTFSSLIILCILSLSMLPNLNPLYIIPFGLNSMLLVTKGVSTNHITLLLCFYLLLLITIIYYLLKKRDFDF